MGIMNSVDALMETLCIVYSIVIFVWYRKFLRKHFIVIYRSLFYGILGELLGSFVVGACLAIATVYAWYVADIVILIAGFVAVAKSQTSVQKKICYIIMFIFIAVVTFAGISIKREEARNEAEMEQEYSDEDDSYNDMDDEGYVDYEDNDFVDEAHDDHADEEPYNDDLSDELNDRYDEGNYDNEESNYTDDWEDEPFEELDVNVAETYDNAENDDILPWSSSVYLSMYDLEGLTKDECHIARNEIYARHGRLFSDESLQNYFNSKDWYDGYIAPEDFDESVLNEYEISNRDLIIQYETEMGYR